MTPVKGAIYQVIGTEPPLTSSGPGGEGGPAAQAFFGYITSMSFDAAGNLYIADGAEYVVRQVANNAATTVTTLAGTYNTPSAGTSIGDGGPATSATLNYPTDARMDSSGNLYIADGSNVVIRVVYGGTTPPPVLTAEGMSPSSLASGDIYTVAGQVQTYCAQAGSCGSNTQALNATFGFPASTAVDTSGNLYILDQGAYTVRVVYAGVSAPPVLVSEGMPASTLTPGNIYTVAGTEFTACSAAPCGDGGLALSAQFNSPGYLTIDAQGNIYIDDIYDNTIRKVDGSGYVSNIAGTETPGQTPPLGPTGGSATSVMFNTPVSIAFDGQNNLDIADSGNSLIWQAAPLKPQAITFNPLQAVTYGVEPIQLDATSSSGLPVTYTVSGPGTISGANLIVNGAGTIEVTATQAGNAAYAAAVPVTQALQVNPASLTVTANNASRLYGAPNPPLTASYSGFVNGDTAATALTGQPAISTTASAKSDAGQYPITVTQGTLAAKNNSYTFTFVDGTLSVTGSTAQTITFPSLATVTYGQVPSIPLTATASSGLPVQYTITQGSAARVAGSALTILGGGTVTITANQPGNNTYAAAAPVSQSLTITPAPLAVTGPSLSLLVGSAINPATFPPPTIAGFVGPDTSAVVTGSPAYSTTATASSPAGNYPIAVAIGTLSLIPSAAANYVFAVFNPGQLTITPRQQTISFVQLSNSTYGQALTVQASATSGLPVTVTVSGAPAIFEGINSTTFTTDPAGGANSALLGLEGVGTLTLTATQSGNGEYGAAPPVVQTISVGQAPLDFYAISASREYGAPNPVFTYQFNNTPGAAGNLVNGDTDIPSVISGTPALSTAATPSSPPGDYPIVISAGTLSAANYYFVFNPATLTVLPAGSYTIAFTPSSLTIPSGQSRQTSITVTSQNLYQGTVTFSCGQLPANVTCIFSPSSYTFNGANNASGGANVAQGTLTINTVGGQTVVGSLSRRSPMTLAASFLLFPGAGAGLLLLRSRRRFTRHHHLWSICLLLLLGAGALGLSSCGGASSTMGTYAAPGSASIVVTGTGTTITGSGNVTSSATLNVTIQ